MFIRNPEPDKYNEYVENLDKYVKTTNSLYEIKYLDLGVKTVRILNFSREFTPLMQKQLTYTLKDNAEKYDCTLVIWKEKDIKNVYKYVTPEYNPRTNFQQRLKMLTQKIEYEEVSIFDSNYSKVLPKLGVNVKRGFINAFDPKNQTYYYGAVNLEPEEFIKEGHIFVQILNRILKTETSNLVHGACVGINNNGILLCARGQRGKSTLAVLSMLRGFEYVSDDYLTLEKSGNDVYAYPIYSIITLSPRMYNELYDELEGTRFVSNNARKDKYVINIANFHDRFRTKYPIKVCMFPEIVSDKEPWIRECNDKEKGRAITHLVHSTIIQMCDHLDTKTIKKIINIVKDFKFYKIGLCNDIYKNTECLKEFAERIR